MADAISIEKATHSDTEAQPIDKATTQHIDGDIHLIGEDNQVRKVPIPSASPRDPLNFGRNRKALIIFSCCWYSIMSLGLVGGAGPLVPFWFAEYAPPPALISPDRIVRLLTWPSLFTGLGNFLFIPLALLAGRRFSLFLSGIILLAATFGAAASKDYANHMASRVFQGFSAGVTESLLPLVLSDVTFVHQRGRVFSLYWASQSVISSCLSIASSYEASALGWRGYYYIFAGACGLGLIFNFFLVPETRFSRPPSNIDGQLVFQDAYGEQVVLSEEEMKQQGLEGQQSLAYGQDSSNDRPLGFVESLKIWNGLTPHGYSLALQSYVEMAKCLTSPGMIWAVAYSGIVLGVSISFSLTYGSVLVASYGFTEAQTGLIQIATIPAGLLAMAYSGFFQDFLSVRTARRNGGIHTAESRLPVVAFPSLIGILATVLYGYAVEKPEMFNHHWAAPIIFYGMITFAFVSSLITTTNFAVECCPQAAGAALVVAVGLKNVVAFGLSYGLVPLVNMHGGIYAYSQVLTGALTAVSILAVIIYFVNPRWRKFTSGKIGSH